MKFYIFFKTSKIIKILKYKIVINNMWSNIQLVWYMHGSLYLCLLYPQIVFFNTPYRMYITYTLVAFQQSKERNKKLKKEKQKMKL